MADLRIIGLWLPVNTQWILTRRGWVLATNY